MSKVETLDSSADQGRDWRPAIAAAALGAALLLVSLWGTYIYDDNPVVRPAPRVPARASRGVRRAQRGTAPARWRELWTGQYMVGAADNLYRPLVSMSYALQWWLHGDRAWAFHLVNVILHAVVCGLVAELARRLAG